MYVSPEYMDVLRTIAIVGMAWCLILLIHINLPEDWGKPKPAPEFCKLHSRPLSECISQHGGDDAS